MHACKRNAYQPMPDVLFIMGFLNRQDRATAAIILQIAVTALRERGKRRRLARARTVNGLQIDLLILFVDERNAFIGESKRTATVFVYPAAQREARRGQALCCTVAPVPQRATGISWVVLNPEQPAMSGTQLSEIAAGRRRFFSGPFTHPKAVRRFCLDHHCRSRSVRLPFFKRTYTLRISFDAFSLRKVSSSSPRGDCSASVRAARILS